MAQSSPPSDPRTSSLVAEVSRLQRALDKEKNRTEELKASVYSAIASGVGSVSYPPVPAPPRRKRRPSDETAVAVLADWQLAKVTPSYDTLICEERIERYADRLLKLVAIQRKDHPVPDLEVWLLGDIVEGELIFPGQAHLTEASLYRQVTVDGPRILGNFLRRMLANFRHVHVHGVIGNHGRLGGRASKDYDPETNADRMLYRIVQQIMASERRLTWAIPEGKEDSWYSMSDIGGYRTLLIHGDQIGTIQTINSLQKRVLGWKAGGLGEDFTDVYMGHFHHANKYSLNNIQVRISGSPESDNGFARKTLASVSRPSQPLMFVKPGFGVTAEYQVWL